MKKKCPLCDGKGILEIIEPENRKYPENSKWKKYHSCCDWCYRNLDSKEEVQFCGLSTDKDGNFNRRERMKKFEKGKLIYNENGELIKKFYS